MQRLARDRTQHQPRRLIHACPTPKCRTRACCSRHRSLLCRERCGTIPQQDNAGADASDHEHRRGGVPLRGAQAPRLFRGRGPRCRHPELADRHDLGPGAPVQQRPGRHHCGGRHHGGVRAERRYRLVLQSQAQRRDVPRRPQGFAHPESARLRSAPAADWASSRT